MKTLTHLTGQVEDLPYHEPRGILQAVHVEPAPGFFLKVELGAAGVRVRRGDAAVLLPLEGILAAAQSAEPALAPPSSILHPPSSTKPLAALLLCLGLLLFGAPQAPAQVSYPRGGTNLDFTILLASTTNTIGTNYIQLYRDRGFSLMADVVCTNAATTNLTVKLNLTHALSNYTTTEPLTWFIPLNGTNPVRAWTNFTPAQVDNMRRAQISRVINDHDASVYLTNIIWSIQP